MIKQFWGWVLAAALAGCGGGGAPVASDARQNAAPLAQQATVDPTTGVLRVWQAFYGRAPTTAEFNAIGTANAETFATSLFTGVTQLSDSALATAVLNNMGVTAQTVNAPSLAILQTALTQYFGAYGNAARGVIANNLVGLLSRLETDATWGAAARAFNTTINNTRTAIGNATPGATCTPSVAQGFAANIETAIADSGSAGSSGDGGTGGGAAAGGGLGKVLGGTMTVVDLSTGSTVGQAVTDSTNGLVTIKTCALAGPFLVALEGRSGAQYFDEGRNSLVDFPVGTALHAIVTSWNEHIGVSPYTEAATRYAIAAFRSNPNAHALTTAQVRSTLVGVTAAQVSQANATVLAQMNVATVSQLQMASIATLPKPIDSSSGASSLGQNKYGVAATVLGGYVSAMAQYAPSETAPALAGTRALAEDMTDGVLNGWSAAGAQVRSAPFVETQRFGIATQVGQNKVARQFGSEIFGAMPLVAEIRSAPVSTPSSEGRYALERDGTVTLADVSRTTPNFLTGVSGISAGMRAAFALKADGSISAWGWGSCGLLGNGAISNTFSTAPVTVSTLRNARQVAATGYSAVAVDSAGDVYTWGSDLTYGLLGQPSSVARSACTTMFGEASTGLSTPTKVPGLSNVRSVHTGQLEVYAVTQDGRLYQWGATLEGAGFGRSTTPALVSGLSNVVQVVSGVNDVLVLLADGTVWGWGITNGTLSRYMANGTSAIAAPRKLPGFDRKVLQISGDYQWGYMFLLDNGEVRFLSGVMDPPISLQRFVPGGTRIVTYTRGPSGAQVYNETRSGTLSAVRQITTTYEGTWVYAANGDIYRVIFSILPVGLEVVTPTDLRLGITQ